MLQLLWLRCFCQNKPLTSEGRKLSFCSSRQSSTKELIYANLVWLLGSLMFILVCIPLAMVRRHIYSSAVNEVFLRMRFVLDRCCSRKVRELWWQGIPPSVRGKVWSLAIGNELNITHGETVILSALWYEEKWVLYYWVASESDLWAWSIYLLRFYFWCFYMLCSKMLYLLIL